MKPIVNIMWFRRDLRLNDNAALYYALRSTNPVIPVFIFDRNILDDLEDRKDRRVEFIHNAVFDIQRDLVERNTALEVYYDFPKNVFQQLLQKYSIGTVFTNQDYEQYAIDRDTEIAAMLSSGGAVLETYKDHVVFEKKEVIKDDGSPYTVFTPYSKRWKSAINDFYLRGYPTGKYCYNFFQQPPSDIPTLEQMNFLPTEDPFPSKEVREELISQYHQQRDFPALPGTSRLSVHLRFGTVSIRQLVSKTRALNETFVNELIWRDFYHMILWNMPHVRKGYACRREYDNIEWRNNEQEFDAWCNGKTGYPIVDAGMRELNETGFMHNRVRMITASFLCKHLLVDWRWGETYFAKKLLDYDYAANNGGWQWTAGSGCDAAPYFRIFNPATQTQKFDSKLNYVKRWVPELDSFDYPKPIVDHSFARERCLKVYKKGLGK